ncbi:sensor histidine kinase [Brevibacterium metallidurans]|uniref:histidine kinase n=1 Tax=Brevibacterium metallidurans TaxID=1482676 RepID=A0ABN0SII9_9MICO
MSEKTPEQPQEEPNGSIPAEAQHHGDTSGPPAAQHQSADAPLATEAGQFRIAPLDLDVPFAVPPAQHAWSDTAAGSPTADQNRQTPAPHDPIGHTREYPQTQVFGAPAQTGETRENTVHDAFAQPGAAADHGDPRPTAQYPQTQVYSTHAQTYRSAPPPAELPVHQTDRHPQLGLDQPQQGSRYPHHSHPIAGPQGPGPDAGQPMSGAHPAAPGTYQGATVQGRGGQTSAAPGPVAQAPGAHAPATHAPVAQTPSAHAPATHAPMPVRQQPARPPRRRKPRPEPLTMVPVTGPMPLTTDDVTEIPPEGPIDWPKRPIGAVGVANLFLSAVLAIVWAWIPLGLLVTGISGIFALGLGVLALIAWVIVQQVANVAERYRAELVYGDRIPVPTIPRSTRESGFTRFLHNQWLLVSSAPFWRSTAHHFIKITLGFVIVGGTVVGMCGGILGIFSAINPDGIPGLFIGAGDSGLGRIGVAIGSLIILASSAAILWFAPYLDRALDRSLLPPPRTAALQAEVTELDRARMAGIDAAAAERLRIERDLHDGAQPRLVALTMTLGLAKSKIDTDPERAKELVAEAHAEAKGIVTELRQLARGIHPAVLTDRGLDAAVSALAGRSPIPVEVDVRLDGRIEREAEAVAYFVVAECLTNIAKHSGATAAKVLIAPTEAGVQIVVTDNGHGGARIDRSGRHTGIAGLVDRVEAARGTLNLTSPAGGPTTIVVEVPCAS